ncbi:MAG: hypothetical protein U1E43_03130 [Rhodospirillales bacterium]
MAVATASSKKLTRQSTPRSGDAMGDAQPAVQPVGKAGVEVDLNQDGDRQQQDDQRLRYRIRSP